MNCGWLDLKCAANGLLTGWAADVTNWIDGIFPFGWYGVWFILGAIAGERFGKLIYLGIGGFIAYRIFDRRKADDEPMEHLVPEPEKRRQRPDNRQGKRARTVQVAVRDFFEQLSGKNNGRE